MRKNGFTLVEILIVISIVVILGVIMVSIFNASGVLDKARDAQRKKDLGRIKIAFEEYYNDHGCYPNNEIVAQLNIGSNCGTNIFSPWITSWPCDPRKIPYLVTVDDTRFVSCAKWYKILTKLENNHDTGIPVNWESLKIAVLGNNVTSKMVNFGVSSSNVKWYELWSDPECIAYGGCFYNPDPQDAPNVCNSAGTGCIGPNCYLGLCKESCRISCCGAGCN